MKCAALLLLATLAASAQGAKGRPPLLIYKSAPEYTEEACKVHVEGKVLLRAEIGVDGIARNIRVTKPLGRGLDGKAVECVRKYRYVPAFKEDGTPIAVRENIAIEFRLENSK
jgi:protein TonB